MINTKVAQLIERLKTYNWVQAMPELQREFFLELMETGRYPSAFARELAEERYLEVITEGMVV